MAEGCPNEGYVASFPENSNTCHSRGKGMLRPLWDSPPWSGNKRTQDQPIGANQVIHMANISGIGAVTVCHTLIVCFNPLTLPSSTMRLLFRVQYSH